MVMRFDRYWLVLVSYRLYSKSSSLCSIVCAANMIKVFDFTQASWISIFTCETRTYTKDIISMGSRV